MKVCYQTKNPGQTKQLGFRLAKKILKNKPGQKAVVLALVGDLGSGKTTFLQGLAKGLNIKYEIVSPTFIIFRKFKIPNSSFKYFYHFDCYRLKTKKELHKLGWQNLEKLPYNIIAIEWADNVFKKMHPDFILIKFNLVDRSKRKICIYYQNY